MNKTPLDHLLLAAKTFLVMAFVVHLTIVVIGYGILPDQLVKTADPDREFGLRNPQSKEYVLGSVTACSCFTLVVGLFWPALASWKTQKNPETPSYWDKEENYEVQWKIRSFFATTWCGMMILLFARMTYRYFPVNLAVPRRGYAFDPFDFMLIPSLFLVFLHVFTPLTLVLVKRFRERHATQK